jgi:hypothetical protein
MLNLVPVVVVLFLLKDPADSDPAFPYFLKRALARAPSSESSLTFITLFYPWGIILPLLPYLILSLPW